MPFQVHPFPSISTWSPTWKSFESSPLGSLRKPHCACMCAKFLQSCPTLYNPMDKSPPSSDVHGILQARILEWVAMPCSRELPNPGVSCRCGLCCLLPKSPKPKHLLNIKELYESLWIFKTTGPLYHRLLARR